MGNEGHREIGGKSNRDQRETNVDGSYWAADISKRVVYTNIWLGIEVIDKGTAYDCTRVI